MNILPRSHLYIPIENTAENVYNSINNIVVGDVYLKVLDNGIIVMDSVFDQEFYLYGRRVELT